ncbi:DNA-directed RNA polymerase II subunit GRINL1A-like [Antechinus flavipes]|uniref:DNA-directed RNA polymerase II subunit GRINL1A-like n=1 Tax=Antechinus flavipes TaxID=38775 RepID=UPI002235552F|nr:DNA-directed RNA polymerase II subunit GRINL1A-like [Antechinus flavipes]
MWGRICGEKTKQKTSISIRNWREAAKHKKLSKNASADNAVTQGRADSKSCMDFMVWCRLYKVESLQGKIYKRSVGHSALNPTPTPDSLQRITIKDDENQSEEDTNMDHFCSFHSNTPKKPHYMEVLETRAKNPISPHNKFRTNMLPSESHDSPSHSPQRTKSPVSMEERRRRDKKHLDDITAARLPLLHHMPTQLLPMEESLAIQKQQKQNYEEIQGKLAAQKLAERLNIKMQSYNPEGAASMKYREVRDEDEDER